MVNVHGGDMNVVEGRYADALDACEGVKRTTGRPSAQRRRTAGQAPRPSTSNSPRPLGWEAPDAVVVPVGHERRRRPRGRHRRPRRSGFRRGQSPSLRCPARGLSAGVRPLGRPGATRLGRHARHHRRTLEVGDPVAGDLAVDAVDRTGGRAVVVDDDAILEASADAASETGVEVGATGGVAVAGTRELAEDGAFDADDTVALLNSVAGSKGSRPAAELPDEPGECKASWTSRTARHRVSRRRVALAVV